MTNQDIWKGKWKQLKGEIQKGWGNLTDNDLDKFEGNRKKLEGYLSEKFGHAKDEINKKLDQIEIKYKD